MPRPQSQGKCVYCDRIMSKGSMTRHLTSCPKRKDAIAAADETASSKGPIYHLTVEGRHSPTYWLHVEMRADAQLSLLDVYLRRVWLECCGHLSEFQFPKPKAQRGRGPAGLPWNLMTSIQASLEEPEAEMERDIRERVKKGDVFHYVYDFGSSTNLKLKVVGDRQGVLEIDKVQLLARNLPPELLCDCGQPARFICTQCNWDGEGLLCQKCARKHECGDDYFLPVVNSPRMGVCAYTGEG